MSSPSVPAPNATTMPVSVGPEALPVSHPLVPPAVVAASDAGEGWLSKATGGRLGRKKKPTEAVATPPEPSKPSEEGLEFDPWDFGVTSKIGLQGAERIKFKQETKLGMEGALKMVVSDLQHYEEYMKHEHPNMKRSDILTSDQIALLDFYRENGSGILDTARGWMLAHVVLEEEMRLRVAAVQQNLLLDIQRKIDKHGEATITIDEARGWWNKYGLDVLKKAGITTGVGGIVGLTVVSPVVGLPVAGAVGVGVSIWQIIESAKNGPIKIKLQESEIDTSAYPPQVQKYLEYIKPDQEGQQRRMKDFLAQAGKVRYDFYIALGVRPEEFGEVPTWWTKFVTDGTTPVAATQAQEAVSSVWSQAREGIIRKIIDDKKGPGGVSLDMKDKAHVAWVAREASSRTIIFMLKRRLEEIANGHTQSGEQLTASISTLKARKEKIEAKTPPQHQKEALSKEKTLKEKELTDATAERDRQEAKIKADNDQLTQLPTKKRDIERERADLEAQIAPLQSARRRAEARLKVLSEAHQARIAAATRGKDPKAAQAEIDGLVIAYQKDCEPIYEEMKKIDIEQGLSALEANLEKLGKQLANLPKEDDLKQSISGATTRENEAIAKMLEVERRLAEIEEELKAFMSDAEKAVRKQKIEVALIALERPDQVQALDPARVRTEAYVAMYTDTDSAQKFLDSLGFTPQDIQDIGGVVPPNAYIAFIRRVFDPDHYIGEMSTHDYWKRCMEVLPPDALAQTLIDQFSQQGKIDLTNPPTTLAACLGEMSVWGLSPLELQKVFMNVLQTVEAKALIV